ncbi:unnamed protein product [Urochloa humidicola]
MLEEEQSALDEQAVAAGWLHREAQEEAQIDGDERAGERRASNASRRSSAAMARSSRRTRSKRTRRRRTRTSRPHSVTGTGTAATATNRRCRRAAAGQQVGQRRWSGAAGTEVAGAEAERRRGGADGKDSGEPRQSSRAAEQIH